jgi:hypothetical protein
MALHARLRAWEAPSRRLTLALQIVLLAGAVVAALA